MSSRKIALHILSTLLPLFLLLCCDLYFPPDSFSGPVEEPTAVPTPQPAPTLIPTPTIPPGGNLIYNHDFSNGLDRWSFSVDDISGANATADVVNEEAQLIIISSGEEARDIQLQHKYLEIIQQRNYRLTFDARATAVRSLYVEIAEDGYDINNDGETDTSYAGQSIQISSTGSMGGYEWNFTMNYPTDSQARLIFNCGTSSLDLWFDNVILEQVP